MHIIITVLYGIMQVLPTPRDNRYAGLPCSEKPDSHGSVSICILKIHYLCAVPWHSAQYLPEKDRATFINTTCVLNWNALRTGCKRSSIRAYWDDVGNVRCTLRRDGNPAFTLPGSSNRITKNWTNCCGVYWSLAKKTLWKWAGHVARIGATRIQGFGG
jgi:hypothetical protein